MRQMRTSVRMENLQYLEAAIDTLQGIDDRHPYYDSSCIVVEAVHDILTGYFQRAAEAREDKEVKAD